MSTPIPVSDLRRMSLHSHPPDDICGQEDKPSEEADLPPVQISPISLDFEKNTLALPVNPEHEDTSLDQEPKETEEDLDRVIATLEEENGGDPDVEVLVTTDGTGTAIPAELLNTDLISGLTDEQVTASRRKHGSNLMKEEKRNNFLKFMLLFWGPVQWVMEGSALLACGLKDWIDFGVIAGLLLLNACVGFLQEYHAGNIVDSLKKTLALKATVTRNGEKLEIGAGEVVAGDVVHLEDGSIVPADGVLVAAGAHLQIDQSSITGESLAVDKHQNDTCFASSVVRRGTTTMIVTATGDKTFVGKAAALVTKAGNGPGHFTIVLNAISMILLTLVVLTLLVVWVASYYRSDDIQSILEYTLAITIVGVPVGLPAVVTTTMAVGASYLAKRNAIVQKLSAIESLAGAEILCSDKTGTLTRNKLALGEPFTCPGMDVEELMLTACLASTRKVRGMDAIDRVFIKALKGYPLVKQQIGQFRTLEFHPFDPVSKKVKALVETPEGEKMICVKGAPLAILRTVQEDHPVLDMIERLYREKITEFAGRGFRALGVARKIDDAQWQILGIVPCSDPPRHDTAKTIAEAKHLGLSIKMLTGDAVGIARETARQLGLGTNIYNAERLGITGAGTMSGSEVNDFVEAADGFAEVFPQHKYSVVDILQQRGNLVAMTGDGVNDAPSLKKADTGIAVEGASDAARSAADIVFLAPGLSAIIDAIKTSRQIFHRMYSYVIYRIALSLHLEIFFGLWIAIMNEVLDLRLVVLLAIFADIATLAIAYDNAPYSPAPVKWNLPKLWGIAVILGLVLAGGSWIAFGTMLLRGEHGGMVQNFGARDPVLFLEIALTQNWLIFITRRIPGSTTKNWPSRQLVTAVLAVDGAATGMTIGGVFVNQATSIVAVVRVWVFSIGVWVVCAVVYNVLQKSQAFDDIMHGRSPRGKARERSWEDFVLSLQRVSSQHEKTS
ncbi:hypothetical protein N7462_009012 [Penicillium macrosclerotiorum]|uniref:uncharacterized protein n=1 Tax=Penicillium macrosclerotiorum TaxID=303699 RepID=UPI002548424B|nr:uncharacterized protein N7462_009012 [Penicillium macrosclerotiorum]KAJ5676115.1 hypothetical protein N7462_009012 [Penicillium macrosclerotiorum]